MFKLKLISLCVGLSFGCAMANTSAPTSYNNMFISYVDPSDVAATVAAASAAPYNIHNFFFWTYSGDVAYNDPNGNSLIQAVNTADDSANISGYWADWEMYYPSNAIATLPYPLANNADLNGKLAHSNTLIFAFLEAQVQNYSNAYRSITNEPNQFITTPNAYGSLYFYDPYTDLLPTDSFCLNPPAGVPTISTDPGRPGVATNLICDYAPMMINHANGSSLGFAAFAQDGNFNTFATQHFVGKNSQPILKVISVGGYGHDDTFEDVIAPPSAVGISAATAMTNFVNSAKAIMDAYDIDGIDLDYENPNMTLQQSQQYLALVQQLSAALANDTGSDGVPKFITLAILANPAYILGTAQNNTVGFDTNVLQSISSLSNVKTINVMTYDFHGAWDYSTSTGGTDETGFLSNLYNPTDAGSVNQLFWIAGPNSTLAALSQLGIPSAKIALGFPTYGRSLANISQGNNQNEPGLFMQIQNSASIPMGDEDNGTCNPSITTPFAPANNNCNGMFSYKYILNNMIGHGFAAFDPKDDSASVANGTVAYASTWNVPADALPQLTLENDSASQAGVNLTVVAAGGANQNFGYFAPGAGKQVDASSFLGQGGLQVEWTRTWGTVTSGYCPNTFNLTNQSYTVDFNMTDSQTGAFTCTMTPSAP